LAPLEHDREAAARTQSPEDQAARARELGWPVARRMSHHLALLTEPDLIAGALAGLIGLLG
jgi:hypothetical protein